MILAGDTGGTKTVLALFDTELHIVREATYPCANFPSLDAIIDVFLRGGDIMLDGACFGVAGPVVGGASGQTAKITNLPWVIDARVLAARLGGIPVTLLNDLQATALGTLVLPPAAFAVLQPQAVPAPHGTVAVIAPGTGLGEALLVSDGTRYVALPSEGGHADFAPGTDEEVELLRYLRAQHGHHVSYERVLSGDGIGTLYGFVRASTGTAEPAWLADQLAGGDRNAVIAAAAVAKSDPACVHALELFAQILGAEAGNLALRGWATGGVVIAGGIPPKILSTLQTGSVVARFSAKGRFETWARTLGIRVTLESRAALFGAANHVVTSKDQRS